MAYKSKRGKLVKSGTTVTTVPYIPTGYQETEAEQRLRAQGRAMGLQRYDYSDGRVRFVVPGLEPDTAETLIRDGLISNERQPDGITSTTFLEPHNLRVIAWALGVNAFARSQGVGEVFPDLGVEMVDIAPGTETQQ